jgi:BirA family biotin operon repressor/biotin-[acetyl-CoA-carboxylase] ligase
LLHLAFYAKVINLAVTPYLLKLLITLAMDKYCTMTGRWIKHKRLGSTNAYISDLLKHRVLDEGTIVVSDYQDAGRGLGTHSWESRPGENLLMSMLLYPAFLSASKQFHLSRMVSLALIDVLENVGIDASVKWPNDILGSLGKIAGILIEHSIRAGNISHTIVGIGLNVNQTVFPEFPVPASSLRLESGKVSRVSELGERVEVCLLNRYEELKRGNARSMEGEYMNKLYKAGVPSHFRTAAGSFEGIIEGVNDFGELLVFHGGKIRAYGHGSIQLEPGSEGP